ncbi:uncharacterized protein LOC128953992 [Oppia nitens]|uniref:uncharacterized protein LOC128953992 n=1 Tax=Oppia nitens TaxID=1686743 RepID=UPI0023DB5FBF|nr:uncharacterized protein LOC128953992 [Oppia nitens]
MCDTKHCTKNNNNSRNNNKNNVKFIIREATKQDCPSLKQLIIGLAKYESRSLETLPNIEQLEEYGFADQLAKRLFRTVVAQLDGGDGDNNELIGYALYYRNYTPSQGKGMYMEDLYVDSEYRGCGVGRALVAQVAKQCVDAECTSMEWLCYGWNTSSLDFYKNLGAVDIQESLECHKFGISGDDKLAQLANKTVDQQSIKYKIRTGVRDDCPAVREMILKFTVDVKMNLNKVVTLDQLRDDGFGDDKDSRQYRLLVVQLDDSSELIGFAIYYNDYSLNDGKGLWLDTLYVKPQYRRSGVGRLLMSRVASEAIADRCHTVCWGCYAWNRRAIDFYEQFGAINYSLVYDLRLFAIDGPALKQLADCALQ